MVSRYLITLLALFGISSTMKVAAQDSFGEILLQAFTQGVAPSSTVGPILPSTSPVPTPTELLPQVTLASASDPEDTPDVEFQSLEPTPEAENNGTEFETPTPSMEVDVEKEDSDNMASATPAPESSPEETAESTTESSPLPTAQVVIEDDAFFRPIRVNCGSFHERSAFMEGFSKWYNAESLTAEDSFALARFSSLSEGVLFATYRYAEETLTYTVPLSASGLFEVSLQWAEISPLFMRSGARVFKVVINGEEVDARVDVFAESALGSFSPLRRSYLVAASEETITIQLIKTTGQPMLSAFEILKVDISA